MRTIIFSMVAMAVVVGASISLTYVGVDNGALSPQPTTSTESPPVQGGADERDTFTVLPDSSLPAISNSRLKVEKVAEGMALPTSMTFVDRDDILITQKENGMVRLVSDGELQEKPLLDVFVEKNSERGMLGVAVANSTDGEKTVFLYYTESSSGEVRNRVYRYSWDGSSNLTDGTIVLDLPGQPGPNHDGGKLKIGPDGMLYTVIGDLNQNGMLQNYQDGSAPDYTSSILRVDEEGNGADGAMPGDLSMYYAYGIRNSFGLDFDPLTGTLWDTENGPADYDEINVVEPGFNSGWEKVMGPIERKGIATDNLVQLEGSHYADPVFSWRAAQGVTDIEFLNSTRLGEEYAHNIFVGDINSGNLYFFTVNDDRDGLELTGGIQDKVADNNAEINSVTLGTGFGGITDIETGPDGYLYILTLGGDLYRLVPAD